jgi:hypothetical protein
LRLVGVSHRGLPLFTNTNRDHAPRSESVNLRASILLIALIGRQPGRAA